MKVRWRDRRERGRIRWRQTTAPLLWNPEATINWPSESAVPGGYTAARTPVDSNMFPVFSLSSEPSLVSQSRCPSPGYSVKPALSFQLCPCESFVVFLQTVKGKSKNSCGPRVSKWAESAGCTGYKSQTSGNTSAHFKYEPHWFVASQ